MNYSIFSCEHLLFLLSSQDKCLLLEYVLIVNFPIRVTLRVYEILPPL